MHRDMLGAVLIAQLLAGNASAQIVRHEMSGPAPILQGVTLPPGTETLILSGQLASPIDPANKTGSLEALGDTRVQTISALNNIKRILTSNGYAMRDVVKMTVFVVADPRRGDNRMDFAGMNAGYREFFGTADNPNLVARSAVQVAGLALPNYLVEIEVVAARASPPSRQRTTN